MIPGAPRRGPPAVPTSANSRPWPVLPRRRRGRDGPLPQAGPHRRPRLRAGRRGGGRRSATLRRQAGAHLQRPRPAPRRGRGALPAAGRDRVRLARPATRHRDRPGPPPPAASSPRTRAHPIPRPGALARHPPAPHGQGPRRPPPQRTTSAPAFTAIRLGLPGAPAEASRAPAANSWRRSMPRACQGRPDQPAAVASSPVRPMQGQTLVAPSVEDEVMVRSRRWRESPADGRACRIWRREPPRHQCLENETDALVACRPRDAAQGATARRDGPAS